VRYRTGSRLVLRQDGEHVVIDVRCHCIAHRVSDRLVGTDRVEVEAETMHRRLHASIEEPVGETEADRERRHGVVADLSHALELSEAESDGSQLRMADECSYIVTDGGG
jgi:hypothetical protein